MASSAPWPEWAPITRIEDALFWDGDTAVASADVRALSAALMNGAATPRLASDVRSLAECRLGLWSLARSDLSGVRRWGGALREGTPVGPAFNQDDQRMCAGLLEAALAAREGRADARRLLDRADSLFIASDILFDYPVSNLVSARLREAIGDMAGAARAIGRVPVALPISPIYGSTYLLEQGRIGVEAGDTVGAVRALSRYLALRAGAEPALRPAVDSARTRLARLVGR